MKCGSCGAEVKEGASFCIHCGAKIIAEKKFCMECGAPLVGGGSFCTECGAKVNNRSIESSQKEEAIEPEKEDFLPNVFVKLDDCSSNDETKEDSESAEEDATSDTDIVSDDTHKEKIEENKVDKVAGTLIDKLRNIWKNEGLFFKCAWIMLVVFVLTFLFMVLNEGADFAIIAFFQACLTIVSLLIHVNKLPIDRKWIKYILLAFAGALAIVIVLSLRLDRLFEHDDEYGVSTYEYEDVTLPISTDDCVGMNYKDVDQLLSDAGFYYIDYEEIKDLKASESEQYGQVERITINGNDHVVAGTAFKENSRVVIKYHTYLDCEVSVHIDFASNLIFNKYSVKVELQGQEDKTLSHGEDKDITYSMAPGKYTLKFVSTESSSVTGEVELEVAGDINIGLKISCKDDYIDVQTEYLEDMSLVGENQAMVKGNPKDYKKTKADLVKGQFESYGFTNVNYKVKYDLEENDEQIGLATSVYINGSDEFQRGDVFDKDVKVTIIYHDAKSNNPESIAAEERIEKLEKTFPKEKAQRVVVVAMTNESDPGVIASDGYSYDISKFHSYDDVDNFFLTVVDDGEWTTENAEIWHVDKMKLRIYDYQSYMMVSCNIKKTETGYEVFNVDRVIAAYDYLESNDPEKINPAHLEPSEVDPYLYVQDNMVEKDRDTAKTAKVVNATDGHQAWIENQFSSWDGHHKELSSLIKKQLNKPSSFKHVDASFIDVADEDSKTTVNSTLSSAGFAARVEIGDLFVIEEFTAEGSAGIRTSHNGYGIVRSNNDVILLGIE